MKNLARILAFAAVLLMLSLFVFPMWNITLIAPQYPDGISMYIWINKITGESEFTLQNINILNHYVGMKYIEPDSIPELVYFPFVVMAFALIGLVSIIVNKSKLYLTWLSIVIVCAILGIYDFYLWEYDYGHNLSPTAPIKVPGMAYQPPIFGSKMLLNFEAISLPALGGILFGIGILLVFAAYFIQRKNEKTQLTN